MYKLDDVVGMKLQSVHERPPNWDDIISVFPQVAGKTGVLFCYGDKIYNPSNVFIPVYLLGHECVHSLQQEGIGVKLWWEDYLAEPNFRLEQELDAHRVELAAYNAQHNRALRRSYAHAVAARLSGPLYGNLIKPRAALRLITEKDNDEVRTEREDVLVSDAAASGDPTWPSIRRSRRANSQ